MGMVLFEMVAIVLLYRWDNMQWFKRNDCSKKNESLDGSIELGLHFNLFKRRILLYKRSALYIAVQAR